MYQPLLENIQGASRMYTPSYVRAMCGRTMPYIPPEILHQIFSFAFDSLSALLSTSVIFHDIAEQLLYTNLYFTNTENLAEYVGKYFTVKSALGVPYIPRSIEVDIGDQPSFDVFGHLYLIFYGYRTCPGRHIRSVKGQEPERDEQGRLCLDLLRFRMNSQMSDPNLGMVGGALLLVNPRQFIWTGPDPPHHFSLAIIPQAVSSLFLALSTYTNLTRLKLTHLSATIPQQRDSTKTFNIPRIPSLKYLYLGQAISVTPRCVVEVVSHPDMQNLEQLILMDVYMGSIWGPRLRHIHIDLAGMEILREGRSPSSPPDQAIIGTKAGKAAMERIDKVVLCQAMSERIVGGDRAGDCDGTVHRI